MRKFLLFGLIVFCYQHIDATILHVGAGQLYTNLEQAADDAVPGDTIQMHEGTYSGGIYIENLQGVENAWITIEPAPGDVVIFDGGANAWQFTDAAYLDIRGFIFQHQTGNGVNFDDGGTYDSPTHHIRFSDCIFRDLSAIGNNDLLKLSGLDSFEVRQCTFINGAEGGSGIDMVGCHDGIVIQCHFENQGSNSIQMKGGTRNIRVERNFFKNGGQRALNLGGSTDLLFFRPIDAPYEAADLKVYSNVFIGSLAPVAFVGCINSEVVNNTIYLPTKWVLRILQETVDTTRFAPCGHNAFTNNLMYIDDRVTTECNIGPNTDPASFTFSHNFWFHSQDVSWPGPDLPSQDINQIVGEDPLFKDAEQEDFSLLFGSLAIAAGKEVEQPVEDYIGNEFNHPRSIGAYEGHPLSSLFDISKKIQLILVYPNPTSGKISIVLPEKISVHVTISVINSNGEIMKKIEMNVSASNEINFDAGRLNPGLYFLIVADKTLVYHSAVFLE